MTQVLDPNDTTIYINTAFNVGEVLTYDVRYGIIKGGEAKMWIEIFPAGETYVYHAKAMAYNTGITKHIAVIHDVYESYMNIQTGYPVKAVRNISEGDYKRYNEVLYYQDKNYVLSLNTGKHEVPPNSLDLVSAFYYARRFLFDKDIEKNQTIDLTMFFEEEVLPFKIKYIGLETIKSNFGKVECVKFVPLIEKESPFKDEDDIQVWFTNDGNYIPVKIKVDAPIGNLKCELINYQNLKNPFGTKKE